MNFPARQDGKNALVHVLHHIVDVVSFLPQLRSALFDFLL